MVLPSTAPNRAHLCHRKKRRDKTKQESEAPSGEGIHGKWLALLPWTLATWHRAPHGYSASAPEAPSCPHKQDPDKRVPPKRTLMFHFRPAIWENLALGESRRQESKEAPAQTGKSQIPSTIKLYKK